MKKLHSSQLTALAAVVATVIASGCVEEQGAMFISGALPLSEYPECTARAGIGTYQGSGVLDLGFDGTLPGDYILAVEVTTNLPATFNTQDVTRAEQEQPNYPNYGNADTNAIIFRQAEVWFTDENGDPVPQLPTFEDRRESAVGGSVFNRQTTLNATAAIFTPLLTTIEAQRLANIGLTAPLVGNPGATVGIVGNVRVIGRTTGGSTVRSPSFTFPLELCRGCLFAAGADANGQCPAGTQLEIQDVCNAGQDQVVGVCRPIGP